MAADANRKTVEQLAREMVDLYGVDTVPVLRDRADRAEAVSDKLAAKTWRDIADLAEGMLQDPCRLLGSADQG